MAIKQILWLNAIIIASANASLVSTACPFPGTTLFAHPALGSRRSMIMDRMAATHTIEQPLQIDPSRLMEACTRSLSQLFAHLAPLATAECGPDSEVPHMHIGAMGMARAVAAVLSPTDELAAVLSPTDELAAVERGEAQLVEPQMLDVQSAIDNAHLSSWAYHSCCHTHEADSTKKLSKDLQKIDYELVREIRGLHEEYAYVARHRETSTLSIVFRGSCTLKDVFTDLDYKDVDHKAAEALAKESGMWLPKGINLHRGFVEAYLGLRKDLIDVLSDLGEADDLPVKVHVTGHSLGGAIGMLAALDLANLRKHGKMALGKVQITTFGAPRVGSAQFVKKFERNFPSSRDFRALRLQSDAVPHLPFAAWGFRHPKGTEELLDEELREELASSSSCLDVVRLSGDPGDSVNTLRPKGGRPESWVMSHDMSVYMGHLHRLQSGCEVEPEWAT